MGERRIMIPRAMRAVMRQQQRAVPQPLTLSDKVAFFAVVSPEHQVEAEIVWNDAVAAVEREITDFAQNPRQHAPPEIRDEWRVVSKHPLLDQKFGVPEAANFVGMGQTQFRKLVRAGLIPVIRFGAKMKFHPADLERFVNTKRVTLTGRLPSQFRSSSLPDKVIQSPFLNLNRH
jgi:excisionase family DNA binding protein